jgi:signal transduction histidine kinase
VNAEWGLSVDARIVPTDLPPDIKRELLPLVQEALVNAARHGRATRATVLIETREGTLDVRVGDNGSGFPFIGRRSGSELTGLGCCPGSIRDRVKALGGAFNVESAGTGAILEIRIPLAREARFGVD